MSECWACRWAERELKAAWMRAIEEMNKPLPKPNLEGAWYWINYLTRRSRRAIWQRRSGGDC